MPGLGSGTALVLVKRGIVYPASACFSAPVKAFPAAPTSADVFCLVRTTATRAIVRMPPKRSQKSLTCISPTSPQFRHERLHIRGRQNAQKESNKGFKSEPATHRVPAST